MFISRLLCVRVPLEASGLLWCLWDLLCGPTLDPEHVQETEGGKRAAERFVEASGGVQERDGTLRLSSCQDNSQQSEARSKVKFLLKYLSPEHLGCAKFCPSFACSLNSTNPFSFI